MPATVLFVFHWRQEASLVEIAGSFNNWTKVAMIQNGGQWRISLKMEQGVHQYKYIVDGKWQHDEGKQTTNDNMGGLNNIINVDEKDEECVERKTPISKSCGLRVKASQSNNIKFVFSSGGSVPPNAFPGGKDGSGEKIYIARAWHKRSIIPGKLIPSDGVMYVSWGGEEHAKTDYEVLVQEGNMDNFIWFNGNIAEASGAVKGGHEEDGSPLYVGRAMVDNQWIVGKVSPKYNKCYIPYEGKEIEKVDNEYEVLCNNIDAGENLCQEEMKETVQGKSTASATPGNDRLSSWICVVGGSTSRCMEGALETMTHYNPMLTRKWSMREPMMTPRHGIAVAALDNKLYAIGGLDSSNEAQNSVEVFSPASGSWQYAPNMNGERIGAAAVAIDNKIFVCGGSVYERQNGLKELHTVEVFNATSSSWSRMPNMNRSRHNPAAVELHGRVYVLGGLGEKSVEVLNAASQEWELSVPMMSVRSGHGAATIGGKIFAVGGSDVKGYLRSCEMYDPEQKRWTRIADMTEARYGVAVLALNDTLWAIGGYDGRKALASAEVYNIDTDSWKNIGEISTARCFSGAAILSF